MAEHTKVPKKAPQDAPPKGKGKDKDKGGAGAATDAAPKVRDKEPRLQAY